MKPIWNELITERTRRLGFDSVAEFVAERPRASLLVLTEELIGLVPRAPDRVAPLACLQHMLLQQARQTGTLSYCARDLLVRTLHLGVAGWPAPDDAKGRARLDSCLLGWAAAIATQLPEYRRAAIATALALRDATIQAGWIPDAQDALLEAMFDHYWTEP